MISTCLLLSLMIWLRCKTNCFNVLRKRRNFSFKNKNNENELRVKIKFRDLAWLDYFEYPSAHSKEVLYLNPKIKPEILIPNPKLYSLPPFHLSFIFLLRTFLTHKLCSNSRRYFFLERILFTDIVYGLSNVHKLTFSRFSLLFTSPFV